MKFGEQNYQNWLGKWHVHFRRWHLNIQIYPLFWTIFNPWTPAFVFCLWMFIADACGCPRCIMSRARLPDQQRQHPLYLFVRPRQCDILPEHLGSLSVCHHSRLWRMQDACEVSSAFANGHIVACRCLYFPMIRPFLINACSHATSAGLTAWKSRCLQRGRQCRRHQVARIRQNRSRNRRRRWLKMNKLISMSGREGKILGNSTVLCLGARCFCECVWWMFKKEMPYYRD